MNADWHAAVLADDAEVVRTMLEHGAAADARDRYGQTGLMLAAVHGNAAVARSLIEAGADLDHTAKYGLSALMLATINDRQEIVRLLLAAGADRGVRGSGAPGFAGKTACDLAQDLGRDAVRALLEELD